jgi:ArsR family transcriptional regulator
MPVPRITREALKARLDESAPGAGPVILDVRLKYPYEHSTVRLPGAIRVQPQQPDLAALPRDREIVAYDSDPDEIVSARVVAELIRRGFRAAALKGGLADWMAASYPVDTKDAPKPAALQPGSLKG